jgi:hypothetical protein
MFQSNIYRCRDRVVKVLRLGRSSKERGFNPHRQQVFCFFLAFFFFRFSHFVVLISQSKLCSILFNMQEHIPSGHFSMRTEESSTPTTKEGDIGLIFVPAFGTLSFFAFFS